MGMDADVIVIGPKQVLQQYDVLDYPEHYYTDVPDNVVVLGTVAVANTTGDSGLLACLCGVEPWDLGNHRVTDPQWFPDHDEEFVGETEVREVYETLYALASRSNVQMWFRPNG